MASSGRGKRGRPELSYRCRSTHRRRRWIRAGSTCLTTRAQAKRFGMPKENFGYFIMPQLNPHCRTVRVILSENIWIPRNQLTISPQAIIFPEYVPHYRLWGSTEILMGGVAPEKWGCKTILCIPGSKSGDATASPASPHPQPLVNKRANTSS